MNDDADLGEEWARASAERAKLRAEFSRTMASLDARARDPFGLKEKIRRHPVLAAGIAAGAGAILVNLLVRGGGEDGREGEPRRGAPREDGASPLDALRDAALRVATPWIAGWIEEHLGGAARADESARRSVPADAESL